MCFHLLGTNGEVFMERQRMKDLQLRAGVVVKTSNMESSRRRLGDYGKKIAPKSVPHVQHEYFSLTQPIMLTCGVVVS